MLRFELLRLRRQFFAYAAAGSSRVLVAMYDVVIVIRHADAALANWQTMHSVAGRIAASRRSSGVAAIERVMSVLLSQDQRMVLIDRVRRILVTRARRGSRQQRESDFGQHLAVFLKAVVAPVPCPPKEVVLRVSLLASMAERA